MGERRNGLIQEDGREERRLEAVYRRYAGHVYTLCLRLLSSVLAAEDATLRVFVRLSRELTDWWDEARTSARLRELAVEEALALLDVRGRRVEPATNTSVRSDSVSPAPLNKRTLDMLTMQLPDLLRVAFVLHDREGLSKREVAAHLQVDESAVRRMVREARMELRRLWLNQA